MLRRRRAVLALAGSALLGCGLLTGCGGMGTNGVTSSSVPRILQRALDAAQNAGTAHVQGTLTTGGQRFAVDLRLQQGHGATGTITAGGTVLRLLRIDHVLYISGDASFYQGLVTPQPSATGTVQAMANRYLKITDTDPAFAQFGDLTDLDKLLADATSGLGGLSKNGQTHVGGSAALVLTGAHGSEVDVAIDGSPYPLRVIPRAGDQLDFSDFGAPVPLDTPAAADVMAVPTS